MAFPTSPVDGQLYNNYVYDSNNGLWRETSYLTDSDLPFRERSYPIKNQLNIPRSSGLTSSIYDMAAYYKFNGDGNDSVGGYNCSNPTAIGYDFNGKIGECGYFAGGSSNYLDLPTTMPWNGASVFT